MAMAGDSGGSGTVTISATDIDTLLLQATGLPTNFFVTLGTVQVLADGSLQANYTYSNQGIPPLPGKGK